MLLSLCLSILTSLSTPTEDSLTIFFAGDMMQHVPQMKAARMADGTYDYSECFAYVKEQVSDADIAIANLEVPLNGKPYSGYPMFNAPDEYAKAIRDAGFDILITANNHSMDRHSSGVVRTINILDTLGIRHLGTYKDIEQRHSDYPLVIEYNNIRIAMLTYTYDTNGLDVTPPVIVNLIDRSQMLKDIRKAKQCNPDIIIAYMHWGVEYKLLPEDSERELAQWMMMNGVDHIIGTHPHVIQPMEVICEPLDTTQKHVVAFSLGNYISNQSKSTTGKAYTDGGASITLTFTKPHKFTNAIHRIKLSDCYYSLHWVSRPQDSNKKNYRIYPANYNTRLLNATEKALMNIYLHDARRFFIKHNRGIHERYH